MRHARPQDLDRLDELLQTLRALPLVEKSRGVFYRKGRAFLHFHEHGGVLFADLRGAADFDRLAVGTGAERRALVAEVCKRIA